MAPSRPSLTNNQPPKPVSFGCTAWSETFIVAVIGTGTIRRAGANTLLEPSLHGSVLPPAGEPPPMLPGSAASRATTQFSVSPQPGW